MLQKWTVYPNSHSFERWLVIDPLFILKISMFFYYNEENYIDIKFFVQFFKFKFKFQVHFEFKNHIKPH